MPGKVISQKVSQDFNRLNPKIATYIANHILFNLKLKIDES
jgi:hypothetical protein